MDKFEDLVPEERAQRGVREALARRHNTVRSVCAPRPPPGCSGKGLSIMAHRNPF